MASVASSLKNGNLGEPGLLRIHRWHADRHERALLLADLDLAAWMFRKAPAAKFVARD